MNYQGRLYRPPSEANSFILQATLGCSWNNCTYCDMYREKTFAIRPLPELLDEIETAAVVVGSRCPKVFIADGDALVMPMAWWEPILAALSDAFPNLRRVSCYATATNVLAKSPDELARLKSLGLTLLYMGPESGDEVTMRRIAKGPRPEGASRGDDYLFDEHVRAARATRGAGMKLSAIFLLGAGGVERSAEHAVGSARLITAMNPDFVSALTLTIVPGTPLARTMERSGWCLPDVPGLLGELRTMVQRSRPTSAVFRTNHASNYLPLSGRLPDDRDRIVALLDGALDGAVPVRPEWSRGL